MRRVEGSRKTAETDIEIMINLDGNGKTDIDTGIGFFNHILELFAKHAGFDLRVKAIGDNVDNHHVIEDVGILLGSLIYKALGDKRGINRYAFFLLPMDEALARIVVDISGRPTLVYNVDLSREFIGEMETEMVEEFFIALVNNSKITLHLDSLYGRNNHHIVEAIFKGFGRCLGQAVEIVDQSGSIPSTKGVIE